LRACAYSSGDTIDAEAVLEFPWRGRKAWRKGISLERLRLSLFDDQITRRSQGDPGENRNATS
jgi:hypothetical protein